MNPLSALIRTEIETTGPITVSRYMQLCLSHPEHGYYVRKEPLGPAGDFTTAPEISQLFGELIGVWLVQVWNVMGKPAPVALVELGPGRGTLMADILRASGVDPAFFTAVAVHLVEISEPLREKQREKLEPFGKKLHFHNAVDDLPGTPTLCVANEFFDALPANQWVRSENGWHARKIGVDADGALTFGVDPTPLPALPKPMPNNAQPGTIAEHSPVQAATMATLCAHLKQQTGAALIIDYGSLEPGFGDTLQAVRNHNPADPLSDPGEADLTTQIDFSHLRNLALNAGLPVTSWATQGDFLVRMGLLERAGQLGAYENQVTRGAISDAVERLASDMAMGKLFKVLGLASEAVALPGFADVQQMETPQSQKDGP